VFQAYPAEIEALQEEKARTIAAYRERHDGAEPFDDRSLEVLSRIAIEILR
jgi:hypothetical protein